MNQPPSLDEIRRQLTATFDDESLTRLCYDHYQAVYRRFAAGMSLRQKARALATYCDREGLLLELLRQMNFAPSTPPPETMEASEARALCYKNQLPPLTPPPGPIRQRWALLVGINRYVDPSFPRLNFCVNDVLDLAETLKGLSYTVVTLHDKADQERLRPTRDNIEAELAALCAAAEPDDLILVHFAGHGFLVEGAPVLITRETRAATLARKALRLAELEAQIRASRARRLVLILDACHTGVELGRDLTDPAFIHHAYDLAEGFALLAASTAQQKALEWGEKEHGLFTYYLLEGLSGQADQTGKGFVTVDDLKTYLLAHLRRWGVEHGLSQEPTARSEGLGDMILADYRSAGPSSVPPREGEGKESSPLGGELEGGILFPPNPFGLTGKIADPDQFFDREDLLRQIFEELGKGVNLSLVGESQIGKSSLLEMICHLGPARLNLQADAFAYLSLQWVQDEDDFYEALCEALGIEVVRGYKLVRALQGKRVILCLDEIERMTWDGFTLNLRSHLRGLADGAEAPLKLVVASRSPLSRLFPDSPDLDSPLAGICRQLDVGPFPPDIIRQFLCHHLQGTGVTFSQAQITGLINQSNGHPARLHRAAADLYRQLTQSQSPTPDP